jgi:hypothetical protein
MSTRMVIPIREHVDSYREPTLAEILSDCIVEAVMKADGVDPTQLSVMLGKIARMLALGDDRGASP